MTHTTTTARALCPLTVAELPTLATIDEARSVLRTSRSTVLRLISTGRLTTAKLAEGGSSRVLIPRRSIERLVAELEGVSP